MSLEKMVAELLLEIKSLKAEQQEIKVLLANKAPELPTDGWVDGATATQVLRSDGITSASYLKQLRLQGILSERSGCVRNTSRGDRPTWQYHLPSCRKALAAYFKKLG